MGFELITDLGAKVLAGESIGFAEALALTEIDRADVPLLMAVANKVRAEFCGDAVDTCEIVNARSGNCPEDCKYCAQSVHSRAAIATYPLLDEEALLAAAKTAEADGARRFSIVTAGAGMLGSDDFPRVLAAIERIRRETGVIPCCSLGVLDEEHFAALKAAGVTRYHHNLETAESYYPEICTTHSWQGRVDTVKRAKAAGLEVCSGGIIAMGESWQQRVELAFTLRELDVDSVPVNILTPIAGTALADQPPLAPLEIFQTLALFRLIMPTKAIRYAGGREQALGDLAPLGLMAGVNAMLIGNYLTTAGRGAAHDIAAARGLGLRPLSARDDA
jgi:biotin synthase